MNVAALVGRRVLVTRAADDAAAWARRLENIGAVPVLFPCLTTVRIEDHATVQQLRDGVANADWLGLSSRRGVDAAAALLGAPLPARVRVAAVGPATARAATEAWGRVDLVATLPTSEGLAAELSRTVPLGENAPAPLVVLAGALDGRREAESLLLTRGWRVLTVAVYRTVPTPASDERVNLDTVAPDDILLASPSAVTGLLNRAVPSRTARIFTIGPTTTAAARAAGLVVTAEARRPGLEGLLEAMQ